jgi:hypothetical protein
MLRSMLLFLALSFSQCAFTMECVDQDGTDIFFQPEVFTALIENSNSCYQASILANSCAYGSAIDVMTAGTAYSVCNKELMGHNPSQELLSLLTKMQTLCSNKYEQMDGSLALAMNAFCYLSSIEWVLGIASPY